MVDNSTKEISIEAILSKIHQEIEQRKMNGLTLNGPAENSHQISDYHLANHGKRTTRLFRIIKEIQLRMRKLFFYNFVYSKASKFKKLLPKYEERVALGELLQFHDEEFINNAYRRILKREPDAQGFDSYLTQLRKGQLSKTELLGKLRYSHEGRAKGIIIRGLFLRFALQMAYRIPLLGYAFRTFVAIVSLPKILHNAQEYEAFTNARVTHIMRLAAGLESTIAQNHRSVSQSLEKTREDIQFELKQGLQVKADIHYVREIQTELSNKADAVYDKLSGTLEVVQSNESIILDHIRRLMRELENSKAISAGPIPDKMNELYLAFEESFRGTRKEIKERLAYYFPHIESQMVSMLETPVLDLGCGRGEWLELMGERGVRAKGVDSNIAMVQQCTSLGLDVIQADVLEYLLRQPSNSVSMITGFHLVEHLPFETLVFVLDESLRVLKPGGGVIFETPNPENILVGACYFYSDLTHRNPIPPETLKFLLSSRGFSKPEILRMHPLNYVKTVEDDAMNHILYRFNMEQDYSIIAVK